MHVGPRIHVDYESRSLVDLIKLGADVYARDYSTTPMMLAIHAPYQNVSYVEDFLADKSFHASRYPFQKKDDLVLNFIKPPCPEPILKAVEDDATFVAHNARFEQSLWYFICHLQWGWPMPRKWSCTAARARYWGLRASLEGAASDLELLHQKNAAGKDFINTFCKPRKYKGPKKNGIVRQLWAEPHEDPQGWATGLQYCLEDALAEADIDAMLPDLPEFEQRIWELDFKMNTRGFPIDLDSVIKATQFSEHYTTLNQVRFERITDLRPTQRDKILEYLKQREEIEALGDLRSKTLKRIVRADLPQDLQDVIDIRLEASQASIKKLDTMLKCTDSDNRARGCFLYHGAHTARWSAKRIQPQNFKRPDFKKPQQYMFDYFNSPCWEMGVVGHNGGPPLDEMPALPAWMHEAGLRFIRPLDYLSTSMRGFIKAPKGKILRVADLAQIEVRVNMWLARCMWVLDAFRNNKDVYVKFAAECMYNEPYESYFDMNGKVLDTHKLKRQKAKSAELGCGYQMSARAFVEYCDNVDLIISEEEAKRIVSAYRDGHPELADYNYGLWARAEQAAIAATNNEGRVFQLANTGISYHVHRIDGIRYWLICTLPSGRHIAYYRPKVRMGVRFGRNVEKLSFRNEWNGKSYREDTYGGKLAENFVQGTARDICAIGALNAENAGYNVIGLVHDETVTEVDEDFGSHKELAALLCKREPWYTDLPIEAEGMSMVRYGK